MSTFSIIRYSACALVCVALIQFGVFEASPAQAQIQGASAGAPPGGGRSPSGRRGRADRGSAQRQDETKTGGKPKFEFLLEDRDLSQFRGYQTEEIGEGWEMNGKTLHLNGSGGDLVTIEEYGDFELRFDFKVTEGANSGVMYRVSMGEDASYLTGPEYQILDDANHADGKKEETSVGSIYALYAPENKKLRDVGVWNTAKIIVKGNDVIHYLNDKRVVEVTMGSDDWNEKIENSKFKDWEGFAKNESGHIVFQDHGDEVWFRNIKVKRLVDKKDIVETKQAPAAGRKKRRKGGPTGVGSMNAAGQAAPDSDKKEAKKKSDGVKGAGDVQSGGSPKKEGGGGR